MKYFVIDDYVTETSNKKEFPIIGKISAGPIQLKSVYKEEPYIAYIVELDEGFYSEDKDIFVSQLVVAADMLEHMEFSFKTVPEGY